MRLVSIIKNLIIITYYNVCFLESQDYVKPIDANIWAHLMINESKKSPKVFNDRFKAVASNYLSDKYNITVEDISHTNLRQFYLSLVGYIENLI